MKYRLLALLAVAILVLSGCAAKSGSNVPNFNDPNPALRIEESFSFVENQDGTYSYWVFSRAGGTMCSEINLERPVSFDKASDDVLIVYGQSGTGISSRWAKFCDIQRNRISDTFGYFLAALGTRVAHVEQRTGEYHVFVSDMFDGVVYSSYTLKDYKDEGTEPIKDFALDKDGVLSVVYTANTGEKTLKVDLSAN